MKAIIILFCIILVILCYSCKDDSSPNTSTPVSGITSISGTIPNYTLGAGKAIKLTLWGNAYTDYPVFGSSTVDGNGDFNINALSAVPTNLLAEMTPIPTGVVFSDPSTKAKGGCALRIYTTSPTKPTHTVDRGIFHTPSEVGDYYINFLYSDRASTVKGTDANTKNIWNLSLKKGWNKIVQLVKQADPEIIEYTNIEPSGGYWYLYEM